MNLATKVVLGVLGAGLAYAIFAPSPVQARPFANLPVGTRVLLKGRPGVLSIVSRSQPQSERGLWSYGVIGVPAPLLGGPVVVSESDIGTLA